MNFEDVIDRYITRLVFLTRFTHSGEKIIASHPHLPDVVHGDLEFVVATVRQKAENFVHSRLVDGTGLPNVNQPHD